MPEFDFFVGGIEDAIIGVLTAAYKAPAGYLKDLGSYGGELDEDTLKRFVQELAPRFPLMLVAYGDGKDTMAPATSVAFGQPRIFRHDCHFTIICCDNDARGEKQRRRGAAGGGNPGGVIKMIADVRAALSGIRFKSGVELLTLQPLTPAGVEYLARLPELTAYAVHFETYFKWTEPDRRDVPVAVEELLLDIESLNEPGQSGGLPGVVMRIGD